MIEIISYCIILYQSKVYSKDLTWSKIYNSPIYSHILYSQLLQIKQLDVCKPCYGIEKGCSSCLHLPLRISTKKPEWVKQSHPRCEEDALSVHAGSAPSEGEHSMYEK